MQKVEAPGSGPAASRVPREGVRPLNESHRRNPVEQRIRKGRAVKNGGGGRGENAQENSTDNLQLRV